MMKIPIFILLVVAIVSVQSTFDIRDTALHNPDLFEGDILGYDPDIDRNAIPYAHARWPEGVVPYVIDISLKDQSKLIKQAMEEYHKTTCLRFVPRTNEKNYIKFFLGNGCYSFVGLINKGEQKLSLGIGCHVVGTIIHEIGHALGLFHEQNRSDRDDYLDIYWENIEEGHEKNFKKRDPKGNILYTPFDHDSIMLYGNYAFSKDGRSMTMVAKNGKKLLEPYEKRGLTPDDITNFRKMYNC